MGPVQQFCNVLAIYMPSVMSYAGFIGTIWLAYALHQTYNLFRNLAGGTKHFLNFTNQFEVRANAAPFCCFWKACPVIQNSPFVMKVIRNVIYQFIFVTLGLTVIQAALVSDRTLYSRGTDADPQATAHSSLVLTLSIIKGFCTLAAMWGFTLQFKFLVEADVFTERFALKGKRWTITFTMIINGILPFVFTIFPINLECKPPFGFSSRSRVFECFLYQPMLMMTQWLALKAYCQEETIKHCCINNEDHKENSTCTTHKFRKQRNRYRSGTKTSGMPPSEIGRSNTFNSTATSIFPNPIAHEPVNLNTKQSQNTPYPSAPQQSPDAPPPAVLNLPVGLRNHANRRRSAISVTDLATINENYLKSHENLAMDGDF